jgi:hypothetical protein
MKIMAKAFLLLGSVTVFLGCEQEMHMDGVLTKKQIIKIANEELVTGLFEFDLRDYEVYYDVGNKKWADKAAHYKKDPLDFEKRFKVLENHDFQVVRYKMKGKDVLGGVIWVFVDRKTGEVLTWFGER